MNAFLAIFQREIRAYFVSPMAWTILAFVLLVNGWIFFLIVDHLSDPRQPPGATPFDYFFGSLVFWIVLLVVVPVITMRLVAEERRSGSLEPLMTAPVTDAQVILAKFSAAWAFYLFLWLPTLAYPLVIARFTAVDWGPIAGGYTAIATLGAMFLAIGLFASSFTRHQIVAAVASFGLLMVAFAAPWSEGLFGEGTVASLLQYANLSLHVDEMARGIVDTRRPLYHLSTAALFLFLATRSLETRKWR